MRPFITLEFAMQMLKLWPLSLACLFLASCAGMEESYRMQVCHRDFGYEQGVNDGRAGRPMNSAFAGNCDPRTRDQVSQAYRQGYESARPGNGLDDNDDDGFRMRGGGFDIRVPGRPNNKKWVCEAQAFGHTYSGFGASRGEASQKAREKCEVDNHAMHCSNIDCEKAD